MFQLKYLVSLNVTNFNLRIDMKYLVLIISLSFFLFSCKKKLTQFYIDFNSPATIPATIPINSPFTIYTPEEETNSEFEFQSNDTRKDRIREILLKDMEISITSPDGTTFSFLKELELFINTDGLTERKIAFKENINEDVGSKIICDVLDVDLQEYIKADNFTLRLRTVTNEVITEDIDVDIYSNFLVDAKLIK